MIPQVLEEADSALCRLEPPPPPPPTTTVIVIETKIMIVVKRKCSCCHHSQKLLKSKHNEKTLKATGNFWKDICRVTKIKISRLFARNGPARRQQSSTSKSLKGKVNTNYIPSKSESEIQTFSEQKLGRFIVSNWATRNRARTSAGGSSRDRHLESLHREARQVRVV